MLEEYLRVAREVPATSSCSPASLSESILEIISLHIPMRQVLCGWVASSCVILLGFPGCEYPRTDISGVETKSCHNVFRGKEKFLWRMQEEALRGVYYNLPPCTWNFSPRIRVSLFSLMGIPSLYFTTASSRSSCSRLCPGSQEVCVQTRVVVKLVKKKYSICNIE